MNPRNQVTSPLPGKEHLLPWVDDTSKGNEGDEGGASVSGGAARAVIAMIPELFDAKRNADLDAERRGESRLTLPVAVKEYFEQQKHYTPEMISEKLAALRFACALHKSIPKVGLFQGMPS